VREGYFVYLILRKWEFSKEYVQTIKRLLQFADKRSVIGAELSVQL